MFIQSCLGDKPRSGPWFLLEEHLSVRFFWEENFALVHHARFSWGSLWWGLTVWSIPSSHGCKFLKGNLGDLITVYNTISVIFYTCSMRFPSYYVYIGKFIFARFKLISKSSWWLSNLVSWKRNGILLEYQYLSPKSLQSLDSSYSKNFWCVQI